VQEIQILTPCYMSSLIRASSTQTYLVLASLEMLQHVDPFTSKVTN